MPVIYPDTDAWRHQALAQLASRGRTRVAMVTYLLSRDGERRFIQQAAEYGLTAAPYRIFSTYSNSADILRNAIHCMMRLPEEIRPDGLLIADDNLVEATVAGLHDAGTRVPDELDIVAMCNYPHLPTSALPICWLGTHTHELLQRCIALLNASRRGEAYPLVTHLPPVFLREQEGHVS